MRRSGRSSGRSQDHGRGELRDFARKAVREAEWHCLTSVLRRTDVVQNRHEIVIGIRCANVRHELDVHVLRCCGESYFGGIGGSDSAELDAVCDQYGLSAAVVCHKSNGDVGWHHLWYLGHDTVQSGKKVPLSRQGSYIVNRQAEYSLCHAEKDAEGRWR